MPKHWPESKKSPLLKNPLKMDRKLLRKIRNRRHGQKRTPGQELFIITLSFIQTVCLCIIGLGISAVREQDKIRNTHFEPILNKLYLTLILFRFQDGERDAAPTNGGKSNCDLKMECL